MSETLFVGGILNESATPCYTRNLDIELDLDCFDGKTGGCMLVIGSDDDGIVSGGFIVSPGCPIHPKDYDPKVRRIKYFDHGEAR